MANFIQGSQLRLLNFGNQVIKLNQTLPATTTSTLFTVSGGSVLVTGLLGFVSTTAFGATVTSLSLGTAGTGLAASTASIAASTVVTSTVKGAWLTPGATSGAALVGAAATVPNAPPTANPFVVPAGTITWTTTATDTGAVDWYLMYVPLDTGASVA